jgi:aminoglycoside 6'-N-acetyltransferase I
LTSLPLVIRYLQKPDIAEWAALRHGLWPHLSLERHRVDISEILGRGGVRGYGCFLGGEAALADDGQPILIGFAELAIRPYANGCTQTPVPFLEGIFVDEAYRRNGAASADRSDE